MSIVGRVLTTSIFDLSVLAHVERGCRANMFATKVFKSKIFEGE